MRYLIPIIFLFNLGLATAQELIIRQDQRSTDSVVKFEMLDATDGYTPETGLSPTCTVNGSLSTSYTSSTNSVTEIGNGTYQLILSPQEIQNAGLLSMYCTGSGARARHPKVRILEAGPYQDGANFLVSPSNYNNTTYWTKTASTVTEDNATDYLGLTIADTLTGDGTSAQHRVTQSVIKPEGSGMMYFTTEVKTGTLNNAWVGDRSYAAGLDINTSTGAIVTQTAGYLRGWKVDKLAYSWWRVHILYNTGQTDATSLGPTIALGNGTTGAPPTFTTSGTMLFARTKLMRAEDVNPDLIATILPNLASASSASSVTLDANETTSNDVYKNRQICFGLGYTASILWKVQTYCSCIVSYSGSTKVAGLSPALGATLNNTYKYRIGGVCLPDVNVTSMANNVITADKIAADSIGASEIASDAIGASEIADDAIDAGAIASNAITSSEFAQSAGDKVWNTDPTTCSTSNTALCYLEKAKKYVANKLAIVGSNYTLYEDDQVTSYETGTTNSSGRDPN